MTRTIAGFGLGLRNEFVTELPKLECAIDWLEIIPENWIDIGGPRLKAFDANAERWPMVPHSVTMSIGGPDPLDDALFRHTTALAKRIGAPFWSDHIAYATLEGTYFNDLYPLPFNEEAVEHVLRRIRVARTMTDLPLVFENPTYYAKMPGSTMSESAFLTTIIQESTCGFLLDVNNVYVNSLNHGFDPREMIDALPLETVCQVHIAGHTRLHSGLVLDTHGSHVAPEVWDLYRYTLRRLARPIPVLLEWDNDVPAIDILLRELDRARDEAAASSREGS